MGRNWSRSQGMMSLLKKKSFHGNRSPLIRGQEGRFTIRKAVTIARRRMNEPTVGVRWFAETFSLVEGETGNTYPRSGAFVFFFSIERRGGRYESAGSGGR